MEIQLFEGYLLKRLSFSNALAWHMLFLNQFICTWVFLLCSLYLSFYLWGSIKGISILIPSHHLLKSHILRCRRSGYAKIGISWKFIWCLRALPLSCFPKLLDLIRNQMSAWCLLLVMSPEFPSSSSSRLKMWKLQHTLPSHLMSFIRGFEVESIQ